MNPAAASLLLSCAILLMPDWPATAPASPAGVAVLILGPALLVWRLAGPGWAMAVALAAWCAGSASLAMADRLPPARWGEDQLVTGRICDFPRIAEGVARFTLETETGAGTVGLPRRIQVSWYDVVDPPAVGERWRLQLRLRSPRGLANPGGFDFERWLLSRRIGATAWVRPDTRNGRLVGGPQSCAVAAARARIAAGITAVAGESPALPYLLGLSVGAYQELPAADWEVLRRTGTVHLMAISGFHVALVAAPAGLLGALAGRGLLVLGVRLVPRVAGALAAVATATGYGALAGFTVPTLRAVLMLAAVTLLLVLRRPLAPLTVLSLALMLVLLAEPLAPLSPGFWLSFAGVGILLACLGSGQSRAQPAVGKPGLTRRGSRAVGNFVLTQLAVMAGLAPLLAAFFAQVPLAGSMANLVAIPLFSLVVVPFTLAGALLTLVSPAVAAPVLEVAGLALGLWRDWLDWCAALPIALWELPPAGTRHVLVAAAGALWLLWPGPAPGRWLGLPLLALLAHAGPVPPPPGGFRVTVLDVGQGLSVLVQTHSHSLIYDAGPAYRGSDAGERVVVPALRALRVRRPDLLLVSHADLDHRGGAGGVLRRFPPIRIVGPVPTPPGRPPAESCRAGGAWVWDGVWFEILHPPSGVVSSGRRVGNNDSCVLLVRTATASALLPGDIEREAEDRLVAEGLLPPVDLVVAPHHGSRTSSGARFTMATSPRYVVFATGFRNRWRFPANEVAARWQAIGACTLETAIEGAITFETVPGRRLALTGTRRRAVRRFWQAGPPPAGARPCAGDLSGPAATGV